ncbi:MAG: formyltransferase family protein [bacterium]|nr:formyltransferase family protein [bacterium]
MRKHKPVRIVILTSIRDVGGDDLNGQFVPTKNGSEYMKGIVEHVVEECRPDGELHGIVELAGVITDDTAKGLAKSGYPLTPTHGELWIHPIDLRDHHGVKVVDMTRNYPSFFRTLPLDDVSGRRAAKREYEAGLLGAMEYLGARVLISDHYMAKIEYLIDEFGLYGQVLNIHPAVTQPGHPFCFRGKTPTADALARAKSGRETRTGATLHLVNSEFDDGPIVECAAETPVHADDTPQELRWRNYQMAKLPVFTRGMLKYAYQQPDLA